jgi:hypothetical protein
VKDSEGYPDQVRYAIGLAHGFKQCAESLPMLAGVVEAMARLDFVTAAAMLGIEPGQATILQRELRMPVVGQGAQNAYEAGKRGAIRFCSWALPQVAGKCVGKVCGRIKAAVGKGGPKVPEPVAEVPPEPVGRPPIKGVRLGEPGRYGEVHEVLDAAGKPTGKVVKEFKYNPPKGEPAKSPAEIASITQEAAELQISGNRTLMKYGGEFPTPKILETNLGAKPPYVIMENVFGGRFKNVRFKPPGAAASPAQKAAAQQLGQNLANRGLTMLDPTESNIFFFEEGTGLRAGIVDPQLVVPYAGLAKMTGIPGRAAGYLAMRNTTVRATMMAGEPVDVVNTAIWNAHGW